LRIATPPARETAWQAGKTAIFKGGKMKGMSLKEIADTAGCSYRTVKTYAKKLWPQSSFRNRRLTASEAQTLMEALPKRQMVEGMGKSALPQGQIGTSTADARLDRLEGMVEKLVGAVTVLASGAQGATRTPAPAALPAPPDLQPRDALRKLVDGYARSQGGGPAFQAAWAELYREFGYRYHRDIVRSAKNRNQSVLDYADSEDIIGQLYLLAAQLYRKEAVTA
jgi:hypothetical protein